MQWTIERNEEGESEKSVLTARHDDDNIYIYIYIYIYFKKNNKTGHIGL